MDAVSNGLDAATTFDIINAIKAFVDFMKATVVISLLQPSPEVFNLFDDLVLLSKGQIIYHGPIDNVLEYFEGLGYVCPPHVDVADFLQEVSLPEGKQYLQKHESTAVVRMSDDTENLGQASAATPVGAGKLAEAWKCSKLFKEMEGDMEKILAEKQPAWMSYHQEKYAEGFMFYLRLLLNREVTLLTRNSTFIKSRIGQSVVVGGIVATLFTGLDPSDAQTMGGFLFFGCLQCKSREIKIFFCTVDNCGLCCQVVLVGWLCYPRCLSRRLFSTSNTERLFFPRQVLSWHNPSFCYPCKLSKVFVHGLYVPFDDESTLTYHSYL